MSQNNSGQLTIRQLLGYATIEGPLAMAAIPMALFIAPFYMGDMGLSVAAVGTILMLTRLSDVVTDPIIGHLSDRTRSPIGRRKPWILLGVPLLLVAVWMLFVPSGEVTNGYFALWLVLLWLGWTFIAIPFYSWGAEMSPHYHQRTRIASFRTAAGLTGTLIAILVPLITDWGFDYGHKISESLHVVAICASVAMVIALPLLWRVPEGVPIETKRVPIMEGLRLMWGNGPFKRLMFGFTLAALGPAVGGPLYILFVVHVLEANINSNMVLLVFYVANFMGVVLWNYVAQHVGKRKAWLMGMGTAIIAQPGYWFLGPGDLYWMMIVFFLLGLGIGSFSALPAAMKADVIDLDRLRTGEDRTGLFFSVWSLANKLVVAFAAGFALNLLAFFDFEAKFGGNGPDQIMALRVVFVFLPIVFYVSAFAMMWNYPITEERHKRLIGMLERKRARRARSEQSAAV